MEYVILGLLMCSDQTIYGFNRMFKEIISLFYHASFGSLRTTLTKLEGRSLIVSYQIIEKGRHKRYYRLTEKGKMYWCEWMRADFESIKPSLFYTKIFFMGLVDDQEDRIHIINHMTQHVLSSYHQLEKLSQHVSRIANDEKLQPFLDSQLDMLDLGLKSTEVELNWLKNHLEKIRKG